MKNNICELYRQFDASGELLYVGISLRTMRRLSQHKHSSDWYDRIVRIEIERFPSVKEAREAELEAIKREKPTFNRWTDEKKAASARKPEIEMQRQALIREADEKGIKIHRNWCLSVLQMAVERAPLGVPFPYQ